MIKIGLNEIPPWAYRGLMLPAAATPYKKTMVMLAIVVVMALSAWLYLAVLGKAPSGGRPTGGSGTLDELQQRADAQRKELMRRPTVPIPKPPPAAVPGPQSERR